MGHSSLGQASTRLQPVHPSEARTLLPPRLRVRRQISTPETALSGFPIRFRHGPSVARYSALCAGAGGCGAEKPFLLLAEGVHGVEAGGAASRQVAGGAGDQQEERGGGQEQRVVGGGEGEEHGAESPGGGNGSRGSEQRACQGEKRDIAHHHAGDGPAFGAEGQTDADFPGAALHGVGDDTVDADSGQGESQQAETGGEERSEFFVAELGLDAFGKRVYGADEEEVKKVVIPEGEETYILC